MLLRTTVKPVYSSRRADHQPVGGSRIRGESGVGSSC